MAYKEIRKASILSIDKAYKTVNLPQEIKILEMQ